MERIRWNNGWVGVTRAKQVRTTISDPAADRAPDVNRQVRVSGPNELFFADVTFVPMNTRVFACTAFVIVAYAGTIVGWGCSTSRTTRGLTHRRPDSPPTSRSSDLPRARIVALTSGGSQFGWAG